MVSGAGTDLCQLVGRKGRGATNSLGEHTARQPADRGERWFSAGCMRGTSCLCSGPAGGVDRIRRNETELECWARVDDITIATTAELAPFVTAKLKETLEEKHGLELRSAKCTAYCPTPERTIKIREEMTQFVKWTPSGLMIWGTASDGE